MTAPGEPQCILKIRHAGAALRCLHPRTAPEDAALLGVTYGRVGQRLNLVNAEAVASRVLLLTSGPLRRRRGAQGKREPSGPVV